MTSCQHDGLSAPTVRQRLWTDFLNITERVDQSFSWWRGRRAGATDDAFIKAWEAAWADGWQRRWQGSLQDAVPYAHEALRAAWLTGWQWADAHPDRVQPIHLSTQGDRRRRVSRVRFARTVRGGLAGLAILTIARWWWHRRRTVRRGTV